MNDYRRLQQVCETQAALSGGSETRKALREMADEYRRRADAQDCAETAWDNSMSYEGIESPQGDKRSVRR